MPYLTLISGLGSGVLPLRKCAIESGWLLQESNLAQKYGCGKTWGSKSEAFANVLHAPVSHASMDVVVYPPPFLIAI